MRAKATGPAPEPGSAAAGACRFGHADIVEAEAGAAIRARAALLGP